MVTPYALHIYALRITKVTNMLLSPRLWKVGLYIRLVSANEQEPSLGFGNFDTAAVPLVMATFAIHPLDAAANQRMFTERCVGVETEVVRFDEAGVVSV